MIGTNGFDLRKVKEIDKVNTLLNTIVNTGTTDTELAGALTQYYNKNDIDTLLNNVNNNIDTAKNDAISTSNIYSNNVGVDSNTHADEKAEEILNAVVDILALG